MSRRPMIVLVAALSALVLAGLVAGGCSRTVRVETGERIVCTYGEVVTDTVRTIEVPAGKAADYRVVRKTVTCDRHKLLESLYAEAQAAILVGDLGTARVKLAEVVKIEPLFKNAQQQLAAIDVGQTPKVDASAAPASPSGSATSTPSGAAPAEGQQPVGPVATLSTWVPNTLPGYTSTNIIADVYTLTREYVPSKSVPTGSLVIVVEQYKDAKSAKSAIKNDLGRSYSTAASTFTVSGRSVYFGTDGHAFAIAAWNENGVVVVVQGSAKSGSGSKLKSHLASLVTAIVR